jgi:hypothetical protein
MALSFIKSSGNIITEDFCSAMAGETKADYVKDRSFGPGFKKVDEIIAITFEDLRVRWEDVRVQIIENKLDNATLRRRWIIFLLEKLGYSPVFVSSNVKSSSGIDYQIPYKGWDSDYAPFIHMIHSSQDFDSRDKTSRTHPNKSPQDCLQQFLNTSSHQWAILTNGKKIRILRDFYHSITKGFLEFDLEGIFETGSTEQFRVLYRILHRSRMENQFTGNRETEYDEEGNAIEVEDTCLLESFHKKSRETGVKVGNHLRDQVVEAIEILGNGFAEGLNPDEFQNGKVKAYYAEILNIIYRFLFLMFAEQKGWLPVRNTIYARTYSIGAIREMAERGSYNHDEEKDLWEGLKITFKLVSDGYSFPDGDQINAFGGQLFSTKKISTIIGLTLKNRHLLDAIYRLSYFKLDKLSNRINYANLAIDELGSVYESLLEYEPKLAIEDIRIGARQIRRKQFYLDDRGTDRKTTGSYYTDSRLVAQLIESALVPVIDNAVNDKRSSEDKEKALLELKVADIACGSGAFLCAAMEKLGERLALIRMGDEERPTDEQLREAKRDVLLNCIYGVDLNPMAIELAKFSLWITASLPDMPLSFLDHKLKCGNSLIGATPDLIKRGIPEAAYNSVTLDNPEICIELRKKVKKELQQLSKAEEPKVQYGLQFKKSDKDELLSLREKLNCRKQEDTEEVEQVEEEYRKLEKLERRFKDWLLADVWTSAFFIPKINHDIYQYPTNVTLENLKENQPVDSVLIDKVMRLADQYHFFHFHLEYPEVFEKGGFDCILGNPPWEQVQLEEEEWFTGKNNIIANTKNAAKRTEKIENIRATDSELYDKFKLALDNSNKFANYIKLSGTFKLSTYGWLNTYLVFTERIAQLLSVKGFSGIIIPSGILSDKNSMPLFHSLLRKGKISEAIDYLNIKGIFPSIDKRTKFCSFTFSGMENQFPESRMSFFNIDINPEIIKSRQILVSYDSLFKISPNTKNCLTASSNNEYQLIYKIYESSKIIYEDDKENEYVTKQMFNISDKADQFVTLNEINKLSIKQNIVYEDNQIKYYGLYESKLIHQFNHRFSTFEQSSQEDISSGNSSYLTEEFEVNRNKSIFCRYYISKEITEKFYKKHDYPYSAIIAIRMISRPTDERTLIGAFVPRLAFSNSTNLILGKKKESLIILLANINSFVCDFVCRKRMGGVNLNLWNLNQLPIIEQDLISDNLKNKIISNVISLSDTAEDLQDFFNDFSVVERVRWDKNLRFQLQCELDAIFAHLYCLEKDELDYILETFLIVKRKDVEKYHNYRTKEIILKLYNDFSWIKKEMLGVKSISGNTILSDDNS